MATGIRPAIFCGYYPLLVLEDTGEPGLSAPQSVRTPDIRHTTAAHHRVAATIPTKQSRIERGRHVHPDRITSDPQTFDMSNPPLIQL